MNLKPGCRPKHGVCARFAPSAVRWPEFGLGRRGGRGWAGAATTRVLCGMTNESKNWRDGGEPENGFKNLKCLVGHPGSTHQLANSLSSKRLRALAQARRRERTGGVDVQQHLRVCVCCCQGLACKCSCSGCQFLCAQARSTMPPCGSDGNNTAIYTHAASIMRRDADSHTLHVTRYTSHVTASRIDK